MTLQSWYSCKYRTDMIPCWRNLNHFSSITTTSFTDGSKYEDISKVCRFVYLLDPLKVWPYVVQIALFVLHNILVDSRGFLLLQCLCSYLELDMYASLEVHTTHTLADGQAELKNFSNLMKVRFLFINYLYLYFFLLWQKYVDEYGEKEWDFPKLHTHQHLFDDIENKGVTQNYNTKPNEKMHSPLKTAYKLHTNFKNVAGQVCVSFCFQFHCLNFYRSFGPITVVLCQHLWETWLMSLTCKDNHSEDESETLGM